MQQNDFSKIETKNNICINVYCHENKLTFSIYISDQEFEKSIDVLVVIDENKSHYVYIKDFDRFMIHKTKKKNKKYFCKSCFKFFSSKNVLTERKEVCLSINGAQSVRLQKGTVEFKSYFKQIPVPFKVYADFECNLKSVEGYEPSYSKKYQNYIPWSFACKLVCFDDKFSKPIAVFRDENVAYEFIEAISKEFEYCEQQWKNTSTKIWSSVKKKKNFNRVIPVEKLLVDDDERVRDHCHMTGKFRRTAHWSCDINLRLTKKVAVIFHNLRGYDSHLTFCELKNVDVKIDVIPNRLEKYTAFF